MRADVYLQYARDCLCLAGEMSDPGGRLELLEMAQSWTRLAKQADKNSRADNVYETPLRIPRPLNKPELEE